MRKTRGILLAFSGLAVLLASAATAGAQQQPAQPPPPRLDVTELPLGEMTPGSKLELARSTDNHLAWVEKRGGSVIVKLDGKQVGGVYDEVEFMRFSVDEQHLAFTAKRNGRWVLVLDGQERSKPYGRLTAPTLSANGASYAISACTGKQCQVVVNGEEVPPQFEDISAPSFTASGEHHGYFGKRDKKWTLQLDGKAHGPGMDDVAWWEISPDGKRVAVAGLMNGAWTWVVDGVPGPGFAVISDLAWSADSRHFAFGGTTTSSGLAKNKTRGVMVEDGKVIGEFDGRGFGAGVLGAFGGTTSTIATGVRTLAADFYGVSSPRYTPDGKLVYAARRAEGDVVVISGGTPGPTFEDVVSPIGLSADGQHLAYVVKRGDQFVEVRDHVAGASFLGKRSESHVGMLTMSSDGDHVAFEIVRCGKAVASLAPGSSHSRCLRRLVVDGQAGPEFDAFDIADVRMSRDGQAHCYAVVGAQERRDRVVVNGVATRPYDTVFGGSVKLADDQTVEFVAQDGLRFLKVTAAWVEK